MASLVGFQTRDEVGSGTGSKVDTGFGKAEFLRLGVMHRNTYINSPRVLNATLQFEVDSAVFAGQLTGVEGYMSRGY